MPAPSKRLAIFFDGTDNTPKDRTNVWRAHELIADKGADGVPQIKTYVQGVGTEIGTLASGSIFGVGVSRKIREAYEWLIKNHVDDAEVYVFGFSRGAFTARSFVQMIATCGLTQREALKEWSVEQTFERYESISKQRHEVVRPIWRLRYWQSNPAERPPGWQPTEDDKRLLDDTKIRVIKVRMAGLWDTVGALGADALKNRAADTQMAASHNVRPTRAQEHGYHAIAIDEHRPMFDVTLWRTFVEAGKEAETLERYAKYYEQRWFVGAHSDVGGGYGEDSLPDLSLNWIMGKAQALGLRFVYTVEPQPGSWLARIHDSFEAFAGSVLSIWDKLKPGDQRNYRQIGRLPKEVDTVRGDKGVLWSVNEVIDDSVLRRWREDSRYRPPSLVEYFKRNPDRLPAGSTLAQRTERIFASKYWNETGVFLRAGVRYRIRVVPGVGEPLRDDKSPARVEGEDWNTRAYRAANMIHGKRYDAGKWFALIGTVDKKHDWPIKDGADFEVKVSGQLMCYFNDVQLEWFYKNNSGWVQLDVEIVG